MDIFKTENYYRAPNSDSLCSCNYCRNYYKEIKATYPVLSDYLAGMGGDVEKPFEAMPWNRILKFLLRSSGIHDKKSQKKHSLIS